jgi:hypothetical protein
MKTKYVYQKKDENGTWHCDECVVILSHWESGKMKLKKIEYNTDDLTKWKYPYFAKYDKVE